MKSIKTFLTIVILLISAITFAQTHNTTTGSTCKYAKNRCTNMEGCPQCAACDADDKKEKDAKIAEVKKRNDKIWADAKIKKDAEQKAYQDKLAADEVKRQAESGNVVINGQNTGNKENTRAIKEANNVSENTIMITYLKFENYFLNEKEEIILKNENWSTISTKQSSFLENVPLNIGLVKIDDPWNSWNTKTYHWNLVNVKGEYLLEDKNIFDISHVADEWFLMGTWEHQAYLYNFKTKNRIQLENFYKDERNLERHITSIYLPIYPNTTEWNTLINNKEVLARNASKKVKNKLFKEFPEQINEEILSKYDFALVHSNYKAAYLASDFPKALRIVLFCLTKDGKLEKISLK